MVKRGDFASFVRQMLRPLHACARTCSTQIWPHACVQCMYLPFAYMCVRVCVFVSNWVFCMREKKCTQDTWIYYYYAYLFCVCVYVFDCLMKSAIEILADAPFSCGNNTALGISLCICVGPCTTIKNLFHLLIPRTDIFPFTHCASGQFPPPSPPSFSPLFDKISVRFIVRYVGISP